MRGLAALVGLALALGAAQAAVAAPPPLLVQTSFSPEKAFFADRVVARVDVTARRAEVDGSSISVDPNFGLWSAVAPTRSTSAESSTFVHRTWWYTISCLTIACVPRGTKPQGFRLPALVITARTPQGKDLQLQQAWPLLDVSGRFTPPPNDHASPLFKITRALPAATYRVGPGPLALWLDVVGVVLLALGLSYAGWVLFARRLLSGRHDVRTTSELARALALVHASRSRTGPDRRRAVGLLARALPGESSELSAAASRTAWSPVEPTSTGVEALARTVEREVDAAK